MMPPEKLPAEVVGVHGFGTSWQLRVAARFWRRASCLRFSLASAWAKTSGLNGSLNFSRCHRMRARWTRSPPLARPYGPAPCGRIPFAGRPLKCAPSP